MAHVLTALKLMPKADCAEAANLAKELGLELQAKRYEKPLAEVAFTAMTDDEILIWRQHCPTTYFQPPTVNRSLGDYAFDTVPVEVMRHWKAIKDNYAFDSYQIWTTERTPSVSDPLLIGVLGQKLYLLARWGLESPESAPLHKVARDLCEAMIQHDLIRGYYEIWPWYSIEKRTQRAIKMNTALSPWFAACRRVLGLA